MSTLWERDGDVGWKPRILAGEPLELGGDRPREETKTSTAKSGRKGTVLLLPQTNGGRPNNWLLLWQANTKVNVNGIPISSGIRCLEEKDEITVGSNHPVYFTREEPARIKEFPGSDREIKCAFCGRPIEETHLVVECPGCGYLFHEMEDRQCFTYDTTCRHCKNSTELDADPSWTPEEL